MARRKYLWHDKYWFYWLFHIGCLSLIPPSVKKWQIISHWLQIEIFIFIQFFSLIMDDIIASCPLNWACTLYPKINIWSSTACCVNKLAIKDEYSDSLEVNALPLCYLVFTENNLFTPTHAPKYWKRIFIHPVPMNFSGLKVYCIRHIFCESNFSRIGTSRHFREWLNSRSRRAMDAEISTYHSLTFRRKYELSCLACALCTVLLVLRIQVAFMRRDRR